MGLGDHVTWRAWHFGIPWTMTSEIVCLERPTCFVDEMKSGPFVRWRHGHSFTPQDGGTVMLDTVEYALPLGWLGSLVDRVVLGRYLKQLLLKRNDYIKSVAEAAKG